VEESYPPSLRHSDIAVYLSRLKASSFGDELFCDNCLVITADTIVWLDDRVLPKPAGHQEAIAILRQLSGKVHDVITGVTLRTKDKTHSFYSDTRVYFKHLALEEIRYYVEAFRPFDKAGAYGIQEWIGHIGIERIEGCYFNVVGLPVAKLYSELEQFLSK
jgi:septum formation protein